MIRLPRPSRLLLRVAESVAFWLTVFNAVLCGYDVYLAIVAGIAYGGHRTPSYDLGLLGAVQDSFLRAVVWLCIMRWAESTSDAATDVDRKRSDAAGSDG